MDICRLLHLCTLIFRLSSDWRYFVSGEIVQYVRNPHEALRTFVPGPDETCHQVVRGASNVRHDGSSVGWNFNYSLGEGDTKIHRSRQSYNGGLWININDNLCFEPSSSYQCMFHNPVGMAGIELVSLKRNILIHFHGNL
jgi:hypothetical protein